MAGQCSMAHPALLTAVPLFMPALLYNNRRMFGSSGHKKRQASVLQGFTKCYPREVRSTRLGRQAAFRRWHEARVGGWRHTHVAGSSPADRDKLALACCWLT